jgi:polar amino acid transport system substrate-binding protein
MRTKGLTILLALALTVVTTACSGLPGGGKGPAGEEGTLARARQQGYITVGFANEKPFAYKTPDGQVTGEAVETARAAFAAMGIKEVRGVLTEFGSLVPGLKAGRFDAVTAGMFIKPERCVQVAFANPEYKIGEALAVASGNPLNLRSYKDIAANNQAKVAVMGGSVEQGYLTKSGVPLDRLVIVPDQPAALAALKAGRANSITMTGPALQALLSDNQITGIDRVKDFVQPEIDGKSVAGYGATAFRKGDDAFRQMFNQELAKLQQSGQLLKTIEPFGFTASELPGDATSEQICKQPSA